MGRNLDYSVEQIERQKQQALLEKGQQIREKLDGMEIRLTVAETDEAEAKRRAAEACQRAQQEQARYDEMFRLNDEKLKIIAENEGEIRKQEETIRLLRSYEEYKGEAVAINQDMDFLESAAKELPAATRIFKTAEANVWLERMQQILRDLRRLIAAGIQRLRIYERRHKVEEALSEPVRQRAAALDDQIFGAREKASGQTYYGQKNF